MTLTIDTAPMTTLVDKLMATTIISWDTTPLLPEAPSYATGGTVPKPSFDGASQFFIDEAFPPALVQEMVQRQVKLLQQQSLYMQAAAQKAAASMNAMVAQWPREAPVGRAAIPQQFSRGVIDHAMLKVVARAGGYHRSGTASTMQPDALGFRCIQGELMLALGYREDDLLPGTYAGVAHLLSPMDLRFQKVLLKALMHAQQSNDQRAPWVEIQSRFSHALAA